MVSLMDVQSDFPEFCAAISECHFDLNPAVELEKFIMCATYSCAQTVMERKRYLVYTHLAYVVGFFDRTKLPEAVENSVKITWHDEGEEYVGFEYN